MSPPPGSSAVRLPLWDALRAREQPASVKDLAGQIGARHASVQFRLWSWAKAGFVVTLTYNGKKTWMLDAKSRDRASPPEINIDGRNLVEKNGRNRMWRAIRTLRSFDLPTLQMTAEVSRRSAEDFINCLLRAGIVARITRGNSMNFTWSVYALTAPFGPKTPIVRHRDTPAGRQREVFDPNTGETHDISPRRASSPFFDRED